MGEIHDGRICFLLSKTVGNNCVLDIVYGLSDISTMYLGVVGAGATWISVHFLNLLPTNK